MRRRFELHLNLNNAAFDDDDLARELGASFTRSATESKTSSPGRAPPSTIPQKIGPKSSTATATSAANADSSAENRSNADDLRSTMIGRRMRHTAITEVDFAMTKPASNNYIIWFSDAILPPAWKSKQAERLFIAGMTAERDGSWSNYAVAGTLRVAYEPTDASMSPYGTSPKSAAEKVRRQAVELRAKAKEIEDDLAAYGGELFVEKLHPIRAPKHPFEAEPFLIGVLRSSWTRIVVNGVHFVHDASGAAIAAPANGESR